MKYTELQIIKHALQQYIQRDNAREKDLIKEEALLNKIEDEVRRLKEKYRINKPRKDLK